MHMNGNVCGGPSVSIMCDQTRHATYNQCQLSPSDRIDQEYSRYREDDLDGAVPQRRVECLSRRVSDLFEDT